MNSDDIDLNFTSDDLRKLTANESMFIVTGCGRNNRHRLTALQYLMKINLLFIYSLNSNN